MTESKEDWSLEKEIAASLGFEYAAPHNRHRSIESEVNRLMSLVSAEIAKAEKRGELKGRIDEIKCSTVPPFFIFNKDGVSMTISERMDQLQSELKAMEGKHETNQ